MKMLKVILSLSVLIIVTSCSIPNVDYSEITSTCSVIRTNHTENEKKSAFDTSVEPDESSMDESLALQTPETERIIYGLAGEPLGNISDLPYDDNIIYFDSFTYVIKEFQKTSVSTNNSELFNDNMEFIGEKISSESQYKTVCLNDKINSLTVSCAKYFQHSTEYSTDYPQYSRLVLDGEVTLAGLLVRLDNEKDYGAPIYGYEDVILFLPYAESLNTECFPALHSEIISAEFYTDDVIAVSFYGDTLPFIFENNIELEKYLNQRKYAEVSITLSNIKQEWSYDNGSGWSPCFSEVINCTLLE